MHVAPRLSGISDLPPIFGGEPASPVDLMWRDLELLGALGIALLALSPVISILFAILGSRLAVLALLGCVLLVAAWYGYYALDVQNPGLAAAPVVAVLVLGIWGILVVSGGRLLVRWIANRENGGRCPAGDR